MRISPRGRQLLLQAGVGAAVLAGVVVRFVSTSPLWLDEALSVNISSLPIGDIPDALRRDGHPPLFYWLLHGWMEIFGDGDVAVRAFSGVIGVAILPLVWVAGRMLGGRRVAAVALVLVALSPYMVRYSTEARMYSLLMLLVLVGYIALVHLLRGGSWGWAVLVGAAAGLLPWTQYWGLYLVAAVGALLVWRWWRHPDERGPVTRAIIAVAVGLAPFVLWVPVLLYQAAHTGTPWASPARPTTVLVDTLDGMGGGGFAEARTYGILILLLAILAACATDADGRLVVTDGVVSPLRRLVFVIVASMGLGTVIGLVSGSAFSACDASIVVPLVLLLVAVGLSRSGAPTLLGLLGVSLVGLGAIGIAHNAVELRTQSGEIAEQIKAEGQPGDVIVVCPDQLGPSLTRALEQEGVGPPIPYPTAGDPHFVDWRDYEERNAAADPEAFADQILADAGDARVWLVMHGEYRTFEGQCEALFGRLASQRPLTAQVPMNDAFEPAALYRFG